MISFPLALCCVAIICNFLEINYSGVKEALREATVTTGRSVGFKASLLSLPRAKLILPVAAPLCELGQRCDAPLISGKSFSWRQYRCRGCRRRRQRWRDQSFSFHAGRQCAWATVLTSGGRGGAVMSHHHGPPLQWEEGRPPRWHVGWEQEGKPR